MNNLEQLSLLVQTAKLLDTFKGSTQAVDARDKVLALVNTDLDLMIDPDSSVEPEQPVQDV